MLKEYLSADIKRYTLKRPYILRFVFFLRCCQFSSNKISTLFFKVLLRHYIHAYGLEIAPEAKIGKGIFFGHAFNITINGNAIIGENCNIHKGVLIGQENRGRKQGAPTIGNHVWIGINAAIVGKITIGDDVLIAPNSYVNCDVPSHSVVFGNPCVIKHKENATESYC